MTRRTAFLLTSLTIGAGVCDALAEPDRGPQPGVRLARSRDGLRFTPDPEVSFPVMESPDIFQRDDGELIALFTGGARKGCDCELYYSTSADGGRRWSEPELVPVGERRCKEARHADVLPLEDGRFRLYYTWTIPRKERRRGPAATVIRSAISDDGIHYRLEPGVTLRCQGLTDPRPCVFHRDDKTELYLSDPFGQIESKDDEPWPIHRGLSRDSKRFATRAPLELDEAVHVTSVVAYKDGLRAYGWDAEGIVCLSADEDGERGKAKDVGIKDGWDPAVVWLKDGSFLMLYDERPKPKPQPPASHLASRSDGGPTGDAESEAVLLEQVAMLPISPDSDEWIPEYEVRADEYEMELATDGFGFAPDPSPGEPVDYMQWYHQELVGPVEDIAFDTYAQFMLGPDGDRAPDWPELNDMLNDEDYDGQPRPWKPDEHAEWEKTHQDVQVMLGKFRDASRHSGYALNYRPARDPEGPTVEDGLLVNMVLPTLQPQREAARAAFADAWRAPDGKVDGEKMIDSFETVLRSAAHLARGSTMIESLVGMAMRQLTDTQARWALEHEVFNEKQLEKALDTLRRFNPEMEDPARYIRGEHAAALDSIQYLFGEPGANGELRADPARAEYLSDLVDDPETKKEDFIGLDENDARAAIDAFNGYYREIADQMRIGYPDVREADIEATYERYADTSPLTKLLMPGLSRYYHLRGRAEASRRATQLTYAVHLHRARTGSFPKSLDELPDDLSRGIRTDPFSGRDFGYRLTDDGPVIYTASENGLDDGGIHSPRWTPTDQSDSDDFVFYPPQP